MDVCKNHSNIPLFMSLCGLHTSPYRCSHLPVGVLCHETARPRCWRMPGRWDWPGGGLPYGMGASCPGRSPWTSRTARFGGMTGPEVKRINTGSCEVSAFQSVSQTCLSPSCPTLLTLTFPVNTLKTKLKKKTTHDITTPLIFSIRS